MARARIIRTERPGRREPSRAARRARAEHHAARDLLSAAPAPQVIREIREFTASIITAHEAGTKDEL